MKIEKIKINELLFSTYLFLFALLKIITINFTEYSKVILFSSVVVIIIISLVHNRGMIAKRFLGFIAVSIIIVALELVFRINGQMINYLYDYVIYGIVSVFLYSYVKDKKAVLSYYSKLALIVFLVLFIDPFINYRITETYMVFGYSILPAFAGLYIGFNFFNKKWMAPFILIALLELVFFANRGAILTALLIIVAFSLFKLSNKKLTLENIIKNITSISITFGLVFVLWINAYSILNYLYNFLGRLGYFSYALFTLGRALRSGDIAFEMSTRNVIHDSAWTFLKGHFIVGKGIGAFHQYYGIYAHNIILDILVTFGVVGLLFFGFLVIKSIIKIFRNTEYDQLFGLLMLILALIPLWFSLNIFIVKEFWILIMIGFDMNRKNNKIYHNMMS